MNTSSTHPGDLQTANVQRLHDDLQATRTLSGPQILISKPGFTLLWLAVFLAAGSWIQTTFFPEEQPPVEPPPVLNASLSPAVNDVLNRIEVDEKTGAASSSSSPIAQRDGANKQGLVNLFKSVATAVQGDENTSAKPTDPSAKTTDPNAPPADPNNPFPKPSYGDEPVPIEDPHNALKPFFDSLSKSKKKTPDAITRIIHFGDSTIVADKITGTMRRKLQREFGDSGHGWLLVGKPWEYYIHDNVSFSAHDGWKLSRLTSNPAKDKRHGLGGVTSTAIGTGVWADFKTRKDDPVGNAVSRFEVYYTTHKRGAKFAIDVDGKEQTVVDTASETPEDKVASIKFPDGHHKIRLRVAGAGQLRVYGVTMGRAKPGVTYDSLGVTGTRAKTFLQRHNEAHFKQQLKTRNPDLVVVMLGTNESEFESMNMEEYEQEYEQVVKRIRTALPDKSCLIASPPDRAKKNRRGRLVTAPLIPKMVDIQRKIALRNKCAFWNTYEAMGGSGSMGIWRRNKPALASGDLTHFTSAGGEALGTLFYEALMKAYTKK